MLANRVLKTCLDHGSRADQAHREEAGKSIIPGKILAFDASSTSLIVDRFEDYSL